MQNFHPIAIIVYLFIALFAVIAIRIGFTFNINEWLNSRKKTQQTKLMNMCPHAYLGREANQFYIKSLLVSPPGTLQWQCEQCKAIFHQNINQYSVVNWKENPQDLIDKMEAYQKQAKKMGLIP